MKRDTILIVDDVEINRTILKELLIDSYNIIEAENGSDAISIIDRSKESIALILLDIVMPVMNGFETLKILKEKEILNNTPVILITSYESEEYEEKGHELGVSDIIRKPFNSFIIKRRVKNLVDLYNHKNKMELLVKNQINLLNEQNKKIIKQAQRINNFNNTIIDVLGAIVEYKDEDLGQHIKRIRYFTYELLKIVSKKYPEYQITDELIEVISSASTMHDIGKVAIPDSILLKPDKLIEYEYEVMKTHCIKGCNILSLLDNLRDDEYLKYCYDICHYHHERWDGSGYPEGLKGEEIPIWAQVVSMADCYDALTAKRPYKLAYSHDKAISMILNNECGEFSPKLKESLKIASNRLKDIANMYSDKNN